MGARVVLSGPPTLMPLDFLTRNGNREDGPLASLVEVDTDLDRAVQDADVVMGPAPPIRAAAQRFSAQHPRIHPPLAGERRPVGPRPAPTCLSCTPAR